MDITLTEQLEKNKSQNWGYQEGIVLSIGLFITGFLVQYVSYGKGVPLLYYPFNVYVMGGLVGIIAILSIFFRQQPVVKWLCGVPASISSMGFFTFMAFVMGIFPQLPEMPNTLEGKLGLNQVTQSWSFFFALLFLFLTLGMATAKRFTQKKKGKLGFIANHAGLWIALAAGTLGAGDLERLTMNIYENEDFEWRASDGKVVKELPIAIKLTEFNIDEYAPQLGIVNNQSGDLISKNGNEIPHIQKNGFVEIEGWQVHVNSFLTSSAKVGESYQPVEDIGTPPSAQLTAINPVTIDTVVGWVSCGSFIYSYESLKLSDKFSIIMLPPRPKKFESNIEYYAANDEHGKATLEVNKPVNLAGWDVYQLSYDDDMGKWSALSVIELVKDPWLPVVYLGIGLMLAGTIHILITGARINPEKI